MDFKQETIGDILDSEKEMALHGAERFGAPLSQTRQGDGLHICRYISGDVENNIKNIGYL